MITRNVWIKGHRIVERGRIECLPSLQTTTRNLKIVAEYYIGRRQHHRKLGGTIRSAHVSRATNHARESFLLKMCEIAMGISNFLYGHSVYL